MPDNELRSLEKIAATRCTRVVARWNLGYNQGPPVATNAAGRASGKPTVVKMYNAVRGGVTRHIEAALPTSG
jgi:hypothetical protein